MSELISNDKVKARYFHATKRFIGDLGTLNDGGVFNDLYKKTSILLNYNYNYKVEHFRNHSTSLNLDKVKDGVLVYKPFDELDAFPFFIVHMPYIDSNILKSIFYFALFGEFLRIAR